jgi:CRP-like cAMP-binding protein/uncharacterized membrane protein YdbT with pleckstrin-like domain
MSAAPPPEYVATSVVVAQLNFLASLSREDLEDIFARSATWVEFHPRQTIFEQDRPVEAVYVLVEGTVSQVRRGRDEQGRPRQTLVREVEAGSTILGVYDFLFDTVYQARTRAVSVCRLLAIDVAALNRLIFRFPEIRQKLAPLGLLSRLRTIPSLRSQDLVALGFLADRLEQLKAGPQQALYRSGAQEARVFLVDQGQIELRWEDGSSNWLANGAFFGFVRSRGYGEGEDGGVPMDHGAVSQTNTQLFAFPRAYFAGVTGLNPEAIGAEEIEARALTLSALPLFANYSPEQLSRLAGFVSHNYFPTSFLIIQQGEEADSLWMLMPGGSAVIRSIDSSGAKLPTAMATGPNHFGETALLGQVPQDSTVEAEPQSMWLRLQRADFEEYDRDESDSMRDKLNVKTQRRRVVASLKDRSKYAWLQPGELLVLFSRRHWIAFVIKSIPSFIVTAAIIIFFFVGALIPGVQTWMLVLLGISVLLALALLAWSIIDYLNDWLIVTNRRVVHQEKVLFVNEWRKEAPLEQIQNVNFANDWLGKILNYGTMVIQTAGTTGVIRFDYTMHFDRLNAAITEQRQARRLHSAAQSKTYIHRQLERRLGLPLKIHDRVYAGGRPVPVPTGWRARLAARVNRPLRRQVGNRLIWRKHWIVLLPRLAWALVVLFIVAFITILPSYGDAIGVPESIRPASNILQLIALLATLVSLIRVVWVIADWHNDTYELSDDDLVHIDRVPLGLAEDRKSAGLGRIQNVTMSIPSPLHWLFNFGNVNCQTAAEAGDFIFFAVPDPRSVADEILARIERYRRREEEDAVRKRNQELPDWFEMYNRLGPDALEQRLLQGERPETGE